MMERNYYMVRAMLSREEDFRIFFERNVVAVGWSEVDFSAFSDMDLLREAVHKEYFSGSDRVAQVISKQLNEVRRFKEIKKGDYIVVPYYSYVALAVAEEGELYEEDAYEQDLANQHRVTYRYRDGKILTVLRNELSEGLQRRLRVRGNTVSDLYEFKDEIERLFERRSYSYSEEIQVLERREMKKLKERLLQNIRTGNTNLQTGGIGLEHLVCELMQCEGYKAQVLDKRTFGANADADVLAVRDDAFQSVRILVQVKHHQGISSRSGIDQIIEALKDPRYEDCHGYFITSAALTPEDVEYARQHDIGVMDGGDLMELLVSQLGALSETTRRQLGILPIPYCV